MKTTSAVPDTLHSLLERFAEAFLSQVTILMQLNEQDGLACATLNIGFRTFRCVLNRLEAIIISPLLLLHVFFLL